MFHRWSVNGYVHKIHHGDWFGGKGVGLCKVRVQNMDVNVYIAHVITIFPTFILYTRNIILFPSKEIKLHEFQFFSNIFTQTNW